jgi:hypothetical protein
VDGVRVQYLLLYVAQCGAGGEYEPGEVSGGVPAGAREPPKTRGGALDSAASPNGTLAETTESVSAYRHMSVAFSPNAAGC